MCAADEEAGARAQPLVSVVSNDPLVSTRIAATAALGTLRDKSAIPELQRVVSTDSQEIVRENAQAALSSLRH